MEAVLKKREVKMRGKSMIFDSKKVNEKYVEQVKTLGPKETEVQGNHKGWVMQNTHSEDFTIHRWPRLMRRTAQESRGRDGLNSEMAAGEEGLPSRKTTEMTWI